MQNIGKSYMFTLLFTGVCVIGILYFFRSGQYTVQQPQFIPPWMMQYAQQQQHLTQSQQQQKWTEPIQNNVRDVVLMSGHEHNE